MRKLNLALWVTSAKNAAAYRAPLGMPCDPLEVERDGAGGSRHYVAVPDHPGWNGAPAP